MAILADLTRAPDRTAALTSPLEGTTPIVTAIGALFHFATVHFILVNVGLVACWIVIRTFLTRMYKQRSETNSGDKPPSVESDAAHPLAT